ncbi:MAG: right-handed parallel beta-helix repeat-containing protein [Candidatus Neomarinimicrobiota bacterium]
MNNILNRQNLIISFIIFTLLITNACDLSFNTNIANEDIFELTLSHDIVRVMPSALVNLTWNEITVENFSVYKIERMRTKDTSWTIVVELLDAFQKSYIDTIWDDEDLIYRIGIIDLEDNIVWATASIDIPKTTTVLVPDEFETIQPAFISELIDDGDSILVNPGIFQEHLDIAGKNTLIKSKEGYQTTILMPKDKGDSLNIKPVVSISSGRIAGFTIRSGETFFDSKGGGLVINQNGVVQNCYIIWNESSGVGGGIFLTENGKLYNNIIYQNYAVSGSGIYISSAHGEIINNTIVENDVVIDGNCLGLVFRNNIVYNLYPNISFTDKTSQTGVTVDYSLFDYDIGFGANNIIGDPQFVDNVEFLLNSNSPCIDTGHPDDQYLDTDWSRNDIGAYGGRGGRK